MATPLDPNTIIGWRVIGESFCLGYVLLTRDGQEHLVSTNDFLHYLSQLITQ